MDEILLHKTQKLSFAKESPEILDSDYDENELYKVQNVSIEDTK